MGLGQEVGREWHLLRVDASLDLDHIWEYIAADNIDAADRWIEKLFDAFEALGQTPDIGHQRDDITHTRFCSGQSVRTLSSPVPNVSPLRSSR
jgi:plasmid stabilization system protein ParE